MRILIQICVVAFLTLVSTGCAHSLGNAAIHTISKYDYSGPSYPGRRYGITTRAQIIAALGQPQQSHRFVPPARYRSFADAPRLWPKEEAPVSIFDEYRVSGLTTTNNPYAGDYLEKEEWALILTLGLSELIEIPTAAVDLATRGFERHPLRLWYDPSDHMIACDDGPERHPAR